LRGTLKLTISIVDLKPPESASMKVSAAGIGARIEVTSSLQIAAAETGSALTWSASVTELKGLAATISRPLISAAADQGIRKAWQGLRKDLSGTESEGPS